MAIPPMMFDLICRVAQQQGGGRACAAGYPDLLVPAQQMSAVLGAERAARLTVRADSRKIAAWHGLEKVLDRVFDSHSVFRELGYQLDVIDIYAARGGEIIVDLNQPLPADFLLRYDLIIDPGTCEHCFNIGQAAINLAGMMKQGGFLVQVMPLNMLNHGFYNINPTWFHDFYPANGFQIQFLRGVSNIVWDPQVFDLPAFDRFREVPPDSLIIAVVKRQEISPFKLPTQHKYQVNPGLGT